MLWVVQFMGLAAGGKRPAQTKAHISPFPLIIFSIFLPCSPHFVFPVFPHFPCSLISHFSTAHNLHGEFSNSSADV